MWWRAASAASIFLFFRGIVAGHYAPSVGIVNSEKLLPCVGDEIPNFSQFQIASAKLRGGRGFGARSAIFCHLAIFLHSLQLVPPDVIGPQLTASMAEN